MDTARHTLLEREPALIGEAVRAILLAAGALGWIVLDDVQVAAIVTAITAVASVAISWAVRARVWAPATVEDLGVLDPDEDGTDPNTVAL